MSIVTDFVPYRNCLKSVRWLLRRCLLRHYTILAFVIPRNLPARRGRLRLYIIQRTAQRTAARRGDAYHGLTATS